LATDGGKISTARAEAGAVSYISRVNGRIVRLLDISAPDSEAWHRLALEAIEPNPYFEPAHLKPAAKYLEGGEHVMVALVDGAGGELLAAMPFRAGSGPTGARVAKARAFEVVGLSTPLLAPQAPAEAMGQLLEVVRRAGGAGLLVLEWFGDGGPVAQALREATGRLKMPWHTYNTWERPVLQRQGAPAEVLTPKRAKALARWRRGVERAVGSPPQLVDRGGNPAWAERFLEMEAAGWKGQGPSSGAFMNRPGYPEWFRTSSMGLAREGVGHLLCLEAGDQLLAMFYLLTVPERGFFGFKMCYDEAFRPYAPGVQLLLGAIGLFWEEGMAPYFDSCTAKGDTHFAEFFPGRRGMANIVIATGGSLPRLGVTTLPLSLPVARRVREAAEQLHKRLRPAR
jgi:hypothetical protein